MDVKCQCPKVLGGMTSKLLDTGNKYTVMHHACTLNTHTCALNIYTCTHKNSILMRMSAQVNSHIWRYAHTYKHVCTCISIHIYMPTHT